LVHWSFDGWNTARDLHTRDIGLGVHAVDLPSEQLASRKQAIFTFYWKEENRWEGRDYVVEIESS